MSKETEMAKTKVETIDEGTAAAESLHPQTHSENDPKSKVETLSKMVGAANCMTNKELTKWYTSMIDLYPAVGEKPVGNAEANKSSIEMASGGKKALPAMPVVKIKEDVAALFEGEELTEEAKDRFTTLFEAAVNVKVGLELATLQEQFEVLETELVEEYGELLESEIAEFIEETDASISDYLDYSVGKWLEENEVAVVDSLRLENAEDFMGKLKSLFIESNIDIPEERLDVVQEMSAHVETVETELSDAINEITALRAELAGRARTSIVEDAADGLTMVDAEKLFTLTEDLEFSTNEEFAKKVVVIKEKYFPTKAAPKNDGVETLNEDVIKTEDSTTYIDPLVEAAVRAMNLR